MSTTPSHAFLAIGPGCWARATTPREAVKNAAAEGGYRTSDKHVYQLHRVPPETRLVFDSWGSMFLRTPDDVAVSDSYVCHVNGLARVVAVDR